MDWQDDGIILSAKRHGETSAVVRILTAGHGVHAGLVRGGFSKRQRANIEPGNRVQVTWRGRLVEQLGSFNIETLYPYGAQLMQDANRLAGLLSATSLVETALPEREPHQNIFEAFEAFLKALDNDELCKHVMGWGSLYVKWEMGMLGELGFRVDLRHCAATGATDDLIWVSPKSARAVSKSAGLPYQNKLLALPAFLVKAGTVAHDVDEVLDGLKLTGYFLERHVFAPHEKLIPPARSRLIDRLGNI